MISRLITMLLFTWSIYMAAFGQHIFGREHIIELANNFGPVMTKQSQTVSHEATRFFADIAPSAGEEDISSEEQAFTFVLVDSLTSQEGMSFLEEETDYKVETGEQAS